MKAAFARAASSFTSKEATYRELPSRDQSPLGSPTTTISRFATQSPTRGKMSESWRNPAARRRLQVCIRTTPRRLFAIVLFAFVAMSLLVGGGVKARKYIEEKKAPDPEPEPEADPGYPWQRFPYMNGFYNGLKSLVNYTDWEPEQRASADTTFEIHNSIPLKPIAANPYPDFASADYLKEHHPVEQCYLDAAEKVPAPDVFAYPGIPANMTAPYWGSYEQLNIARDQCWERFGRFGPYGYSYPWSEGGLGLANHSIKTGTDVLESMYKKVDYRNVRWGDAQKRCREKNKARFEPNSQGKKTVARTAYILRTWTGYKYDDIQLLSLRAMVNELSLKSGGEYDVHLLVHVKDDTIPIWASDDVYRKTLQDNVPEEFWDIATLWSEQQMRTYYPGPWIDNLYNHAKADIYGVYRSAHFALQWFAQQHQEYEYFWNWEMDVRYLGHYYEFHNGVTQWAAAQPRKYLWERSSRFWIPSLHGSYSKFSVMVEKEVLEAGEKPVWGPVKFETDGSSRHNGVGMLPYPNATIPPTTFEKDTDEWGVGEEADLITFDPLFDPTKTNWVFKDDVTGYNLTVPPPPRRAALITISRLSKRLLNTMHEETYEMRHSMFPEMWAPSVAYHHGYKAAYAPHPVYFDRKWPSEYMDEVFNHPKQPQDSPFAWGEHNFLGSTFYYNAGFSGALWRRWMGHAEDIGGGKAAEEKGSDRMCLRGLLLHPIKSEAVE